MYNNPLADVIVAFVKLKPDPADDKARSRIAGVLGMEWTAPRPAPQPPISEPPAAQPRAVAQPLPASTPAQTSSEPVATPSDANPLPFRVRSSGVKERKAPDWLGQVELFPKQETSRPLTAMEPLLQSNWARGILSGALSVVRSDGPMDIPRVVEEICHGRAVVEVPKIRWATLARGVQLLIDRGEGMTPFFEDQRWFAEKLRQVVGRHALQTLRFSSCPLRKAGPGSRLEWKPYRELDRPRPGTTIVALTDLGIPDARLRERQASPGEWIEFAGYLRTLGCPLVLFVPYPRNRFPEELRNQMVILPWDRRTTATRIRSLVGEGLQ